MASRVRRRAAFTGARRWRTLGVMSVLSITAGACAPRAAALPGAVTSVSLPAAALPAVKQLVVFRWSYEDPEMAGRGEGAARIAPPDSVRLDIFLAGGFGAGRAFLFGDSLVVPGVDEIRRFLPPPALLWAALGRLAVPPAADTVARVDGDTLRADIGRDPIWRATFVAERIVRLERIERGRVVEWIARAPSQDVRYRHESARRSLDLRVTRSDTVPEFDASIWRP